MQYTSCHTTLAANTNRHGHLRNDLKGVPIYGVDVSTHNMSFQTILFISVHKQSGNWQIKGSKSNKKFSSKFQQVFPNFSLKQFSSKGG